MLFTKGASLMLYRPVMLLVMFFFLAFAGAVTAQDSPSGSVQGRVTDSGETFYIGGARVSIPALGRQTVTDREGRFVFRDLPAGEYRLEVDYIGAETREQSIRVVAGEAKRIDLALGEAAADLGRVVVYGQTGQLAGSLARERASDTIISSVTADEAGRFPDQNVAEAIRRLPGISVDRDKGEARFVIIRGADPSLNAQSINGQRINSPEADTRAVAFDVIPSELVESVDVIKAITPDQPGDAVGGVVSVETLSAFDRSESLTSVTVEGSEDGFSGETSPRLAASWSDVFAVGGGEPNVGVSLAFSWFDREFGDFNSENGDGWELIEDPASGESFRYPLVIEQRDDQINRERTGLVANFDFRPGEDTELYLRTLYSSFKDRENSSRNAIEFDDDLAVSVGDRQGVFEGYEFIKELKDRTETQNIFAINAGGETFFEQWQTEYRLGFSRSEEEESPRFNAEFVFEDEAVDGRVLNYDQSRDDFYRVTSAIADNEFEFDEASTERNLTQDEEWSLALDGERNLQYGNYPGILRLGVLGRFRTKTNDANEPVYGDGPAGLDFSSFARDSDYDLGAFGSAYDTGAWRRFFNGNRSQFQLDGDETAIKNAEGDYEADEDVTAAYLMGQSDIGRLRLTGGFRVEQTEFDALGSQLVVDANGDEQVERVAGKNSYTNVLPSLVARFDVGEDFVWRWAVSQTIKRPNIEQVVPLQEVNFEDDEAFISNPELDVLESSNLDLMASWYPGDLAVVSGGVFYKQIDNYVVDADVSGRASLPPALAGVSRVVQPVNGESAELLGAEISYQQSFENGFLFGANYTVVDSEAELALANRRIPLPGQSDTTANLVFGYERGGLSLRAAMGYRSEFLAALEDPVDPAFDSWRDEHLQWDVSAGWIVAEDVEVRAEVANVNERDRYEYFGDPRFNSEFERYGYMLNLGVTARF